jgi:L-iditol 2-dehydrogenase
VLIRVKACGICGSDVHGFTGKTGRRIPPLIMGHEAAGAVEDTGKNVNGFKKGDRVCFDSTVYCNKCQPCRNGLFNRCDKRQVLGVSTPEFKRHGAFAEYVAVPSWIVFKIPDNMSFIQAAFLEPASIGTHAGNRPPISSEDTVVVIGGGTIGLFVMQAAKLRGAAKVMVIDINEFRLGLASKLGADKVINPLNSDLRETILKETQDKFSRKRKATGRMLLSRLSDMLRLSGMEFQLQKPVDMLLLLVIWNKPLNSIYRN